MSIFDEMRALIKSNCISLKAGLELHRLVDEVESFVEAFDENRGVISGPLIDKLNAARRALDRETEHPTVTQAREVTVDMQRLIEGKEKMIEKLEALCKGAEDPEEGDAFEKQTLWNLRVEILGVVNAASSIEECDIGNEGVDATWKALDALKAKLNELEL